MAGPGSGEMAFWDEDFFLGGGGGGGGAGKTFCGNLCER